MSWTAIRCEEDPFGCLSVQVRNDEDKRKYWIDVWIDEKYHDVDVDWNQYIFHLDDEEDVIRKQTQEVADNFDEATAEAVCLLELENKIYQDENGNWYKVPGKEVNNEKE
jgi:hypothetical protein